MSFPDCRDGDPAEKLKRKIKTITDAAGDNYDQFTENVVSPQEQQTQEQQQTPQEPIVATEQTHAPINDNNTNAESALIPATNAAATAAANARVTSPQGIYIKLWYVDARTSCGEGTVTCVGN